MTGFSGTLNFGGSAVGRKVGRSLEYPWMVASIPVAGCFCTGLRSPEYPGPVGFVLSPGRSCTRDVDKADVLKAD